MNKESLKQEYEYWQKTIEASKERGWATKDEVERSNFAKGFVSAIDKTNIFKN
ncbi:hypothetical protein [Lederbergia lenta]|uniref:hypothetical protein n=1 Tax=Lederbergia lenta TaxID=1467 RepID=UPI00203F007D|nr:hypothetical protein [Lederbergia lenta]MCM3109926.1 hypothetical protein [Lederbergia lenta]